MKIQILAVVALVLGCPVALAQGTFVYDQQSSTDESLTYFAGSVLQEILPPTGQSFTPTLPAVGFIRLAFMDVTPGNGQGLALHVNLRSGSLAGPVLATSDEVNLADGFAGTANFLFGNGVPVTPGATYLFEPIAGVGDLFWIDAREFMHYAGGMLFANGKPSPGTDYWFRSGIIVPEPGTGAVLGLGLALLAWVRRPRRP